MKKNLVLTLCLSLIFILVGCNSDKNTTKLIQDTNAQNNSNEKKDTDLNDKNSTHSTEITPNKQAVQNNNDDPQKITKINSKVKLYEGTYWDERCLGDNGLNLKNYCEVAISNVTSTSFDFTIYEVDRKTENKKVIFLTNTAVFMEDGKLANFYGNTYTLNFTFPSITEIKISGFEPLEGKTYLNNKIPGHECS